MGCASSQVPDPNIMYGKARMEKKRPETGNRKQYQTVQSHSTITNGNITNATNITKGVNGNVANGKSDISNGKAVGPTEDDVSQKRRKEEINRTLRGDLTQRSEARVSRELRLREMQRKREHSALMLSEQVMEETERLSISTLSRSRATSRTGSPKLLRGDSLRPGTSAMNEPLLSSTPPEPTKPGSSGSGHGQKNKNPFTKIDSNGAIPSALKSANGRRRKGEAKVRIITDLHNEKENTELAESEVHNKPVQGTEG